MHFPPLSIAAPADHIPRRGGKLINKLDWTPLPGEDKRSFITRLLTEGHTVPDAFMTCACAQVGQIMLNSPMSLYLMGLYSGTITMFFFLVFGYWTIYQFMALYLELKRCKVRDGSWYETDGKHERVIQIFEVFGFFLGRWAQVVSVVLASVALIGVLTTQINACANNMYFVDPSKTKQQWSLIYGGSMVFVMSFLPRFSNFRLLNIVGLVTVGSMSIFIIVTASSFGVHYQYIKPWALTSQDWFNGASVWLTILGTHTVTYEVLEHMEQPKHFKVSFSSAWIWTILVTVPQSILCSLVYGQMFGQLGGITGANIFIVLGRTNINQVS